MRIALCFSGQPRTWEKCYPSWQKLIDKLKMKFTGAEVDFFCHVWDYNTPPHALLMKSNEANNIIGDYKTVVGTKITDEEKERFLDTLKPTSYLFEDEIANKNKQDDIKLIGERYYQHYGGSEIDWVAGQFYSVMMASHLKKQYEIKNNFNYDMCIRMRYDLFFDDHQIEYFTNESGDLHKPKHNVIYSCHTHNLKLGDIFWYSNSVTFDRICDFYRWTPFMGKRTFPMRNDFGTELCLYFYIKMLKIDINPLSIDPKIYRESNFLELKEKIGQTEGLGNHEII